MSATRKVHQSGPAQDRNAQRRASARAVRRFQRMTAGELWALAEGLPKYCSAADAVQLAAELRAMEAKAAGMARELLALLGRMEARPAGLAGMDRLRTGLYFDEIQDAAEHVRYGRAFSVGSEVRHVLDALTRASRRRGAVRRGSKA